MRISDVPGRPAIVITPERGDAPEDLEDAIHDALLARTPRPTVVVLDVSRAPEPMSWLRESGPAVPDANLRFVLPAKLYTVGSLLGLPAYFELYEDVDAAVRGGV